MHGAVDVGAAREQLADELGPAGEHRHQQRRPSARRLVVVVREAERGHPLVQREGGVGVRHARPLEHAVAQCPHAPIAPQVAGRARARHAHVEAVGDDRPELRRVRRHGELLEADGRVVPALLRKEAADVAARRRLAHEGAVGADEHVAQLLHLAPAAAAPRAQVARRAALVLPRAGEDKEIAAIANVRDDRLDGQRLCRRIRLRDGPEVQPDVGALELALEFLSLHGLCARLIDRVEPVRSYVKISSQTSTQHNLQELELGSALVVRMLEAKPRMRAEDSRHACRIILYQICLHLLVGRDAVNRQDLVDGQHVHRKFAFQCCRSSAVAPECPRLDRGCVLRHARAKRRNAARCRRFARCSGARQGPAGARQGPAAAPLQGTCTCTCTCACRRAAISEYSQLSITLRNNY